MKVKTVFYVRVRGKKRMQPRLGPFEKVRIREGRYLQVMEGGEWRDLAFSIPRHAPPKYRTRRSVRLPGEEVRPARVFALWRFLGKSGVELRLDAEYLDITAVRKR